MASKNKRSKCAECGAIIPVNGVYFVIYERVRCSRSMSVNRSGVCPRCLAKVAQEMVDGVDN